jgi:hypothetical protein
MSRGGDPGGPVDVQAHVFVSTQPPLTRVHPHADPNGPVRGPRVSSEDALGLRRRRHRVHCRGEHGEEGVALGPEIHAVVIPDGPPQDGMVLLQHVDPSVPQGPGQVRGPFDVGEQERDRPGGKIGHQSSRA